MKFALVFALLSALVMPATAQEYPGCFMVDGAGRVTRLDAICPTAQSQSSQVSEEDLQPIAYADAYCTARREGYPSDVARQRGVIAMQNVGVIGERTIAEAAARKAIEMCPEFF